MLKNLLAYLKEGNIFNAVEVVGDGILSYHFISVKKRNNELNIVKTASLKSVEEVKKHLSGHTPVYLVLNTESVLTKIIDFQQPNGFSQVNKAFPNLKTDDFFFEVLPSGNNSIVTICRKEDVNNLLKEFTVHNIAVGGFTLGINSIHHILPFVKGTYIELNHQLVEVDNEGFIINVNDITSSENHIYTINGTDIPGKNVLGFSAVLGSILYSDTLLTNSAQVNNTLKEEFLNRRFFSWFFKAALAFLLTLLLINFLVFNYYFTQAENLVQTSEVNKTNRQRLTELDSLVKNKERMVEDVSSASSSKTSFYMDNIASVIPSTLLLNDFDYQPLIKQPKEGEVIELSENMIKIEGTSTNNDDFSTWVETLEKFNWINNVAIMDYDYSGSSSSKFSLQIQLKNE
ncbi:PilN domain-containing protein [Abyssalbus ytuae]|uniref:PilN domain-containing protein n=1 Tax=Abyssalbus ytuae TaxID=2926907 RepID=A0A9E6ZP08_9FLAO|nr:PilN domain-containing protein [Abyssalbus ytuae]UOB17880.1 PilN domain-containing protein [Abyssalbus ytuae]